MDSRTVQPPLNIPVSALASQRGSRTIPTRDPSARRDHPLLTPSLHSLSLEAQTPSLHAHAPLPSTLPYSHPQRPTSDSRLATQQDNPTSKHQNLERLVANARKRALSDRRRSVLSSNSSGDQAVCPGSKRLGITLPDAGRSLRTDKIQAGHSDAERLPLSRARIANAASPCAPLPAPESDVRRTGQTGSVSHQQVSASTLDRTPPGQERIANSRDALTTSILVQRKREHSITEATSRKRPSTGPAVLTLPRRSNPVLPQQSTSSNAISGVTGSIFPGGPTSTLQVPQRTTSSKPITNSSGSIFPARLTTTLPQRSTLASSQGSTASNAIDLTSPPRMASRQAPGARPTSLVQRRSSSSVTLPRWQPDVEVSRCPICKTDFGFLFRKHHCRKCGKVVCDNCSRHRITIPRKYIVQPPPGPSTSGFGSVFGPTPPTGNNVIGLAGMLNPRPDSLHAAPNAISGSEEVRVCKPCVPDPNLSPPPPQQIPNEGLPNTFPTFSNQSSNPPAYNADPLGPVPSQLQVYPRRASDYIYYSRHAVDQSHQNVHRQVRRPSRDLNTFSSFTPREESLGFARPVPSHRRSTLDSGGAPPIPYRGSGRHPSAMPPPPPPPGWASSSAYTHPHPYTPSVGPPMPQRPFENHNSSEGRPLPPLPSTRPRHREIPEEDECPVCGRELPPLGPGSDDTARTRHIDQCISLHSFSATPAVPSASASASASASTSASASASTAVRPNRSNSRVGGTPASAPSTAPLVTIPVVPRRAGMVVYAATEKDCVGEDGEAQECVICFEEFETNDEMGRLECWCKFHRACIRSWWDKKGPGSCPTHQLHE